LLVSLSTLSFRNLADATWSPGPGRHLLYGPNGSGKTSLIEAIYLLATTRSFRAAQLADCARHGAAGFALSGEAEGAQRTRLAVDWSSAGLVRTANGKAGSLAEHLAALPVLAWTAEDVELLTGAPVLRRRFLDRGVISVHPGALDTLARYRRALAQKRLLLARREGGLEPWNELLARHGAELVSRRSAHVARLERALRELAARADERFVEVALAYRPSPPEALEGAEALLRRLQAARSSESGRRLPLLGPHRDELEVRWREREAKRTASAGERKALGLLLLAAQGMVLEQSGRPPIFLLDDADAELDHAAVERLWRAFDGAAQLFATSNRPEVFQGLPVTAKWRLEGGVTTPA
jgi:DNA replication and repair protein RecF